VGSARYIIGIDLGTTNTCVAYVDTQSAAGEISVFHVPQLTAPGEVSPNRQLPSFVYTAGAHDLGERDTALPWAPEARRFVGELARVQGARIPARMVSSAKSWLCHAGVDRRAPILPWRVEDPADADASDHKMSPVEAAEVVLSHIRDAWDHVREGRTDSLFAQQDIVLTVPASFDEAARELTKEAAERAGLTSLVLLEEPLAAFYSWVDSHPAKTRSAKIVPGAQILVFDVGGGTTDFTLISVGADGDSFERTAVGDHLLLGGDNIDLTLAKKVEERVSETRKKKLDPLEWHGLVHSCRLAKERLLSDEELETVSISIAGRGSRLIGGAIKDSIGRGALESVLFDGVFPPIQREARPRRRRSGLTEFGLPFAQDAAITRHLANFLKHQDRQVIDAVLFNGGAMTPEALRGRVTALIADWQEGDSPTELSNELPELAVAKGAASYGLVRRGFGARIRGGTPRTFYVGVDTGEASDRAICLAPRGLEEGAEAKLDRDFLLVTNRPVRFRLFSSTTRAEAAGEIISVGEDDALLELPPIVTVLRARGRSKVTVALEVKITAIGTLEVFCVEAGASNERWRLSFDMRSGGAASHDETTSAIPETVVAAQQLVKTTFSSPTGKPSGLMKELEGLLDQRRDEWSMTAARALFDAAMEVEDQRKRSPECETRWLHLTGFCLRPGHGAPLDEWRTKQMWRIFNENLAHPKQEACRHAWWIAWRRIAGGMSKGQQEQIYDRLSQLFLPSPKRKKKWAEAKPSKQEAQEMWRALAHLERISHASKAELGDELIRRMESKNGRSESVYFWALGRIGSRAPLYGPLNEVVPPERVNGWIESMLAVDWPDPEKAALPMAQLGRMTGDRGRDIDDDLRARLAKRLRAAPNGDRPARLVEEIVELEAREERVALGDSLPAGLRLKNDGQDSETKAE